MKESDSRYQCDYSALIATDLKNYDQLKHEGIDFFLSMPIGFWPSGKVKFKQECKAQWLNLFCSFFNPYKVSL